MRSKIVFRLNPVLASVAFCVAFVATGSASVSIGMGQRFELPVESEQACHQDVEDEHITLTIDFGDLREKRVFKGIAWREDMTVYDVLVQARRMNKDFAFRHRGSRDTLFVLSIDGVENRGGRGDNWVYRVDDELGDRSCGVYPVESGQKVTWRFGKYERE